MLKLSSKLQNLADVIWHSRTGQYLLFALATIVTISFNGYYFGTFDQAIHISFIKKFADPSLFPHDPFLDLRFTHYSFFWFLFLPFYREGILEITMFIIHILMTYLTFLMIWRLSKVIFNNSLTSLLSIMALILPHIGFGGFPVFEFSLLNRTFVLPFLLLAIEFFLKEKYLTAFMLLGLMYNIHVVSVNFVLFMFAFHLLRHLDRKNFHTLIKGLTIFIIFALPVLIWKFSSSNIGLNPESDWFRIISHGMLYNTFFIFTRISYLVLATVGGILVFMLFFISRKNLKSGIHRIITDFMIAMMIVLVIEVITAYWVPITIIVESQIIRGSVFILLFGYLYFSNYVASSLQSKGKNLTGVYIMLVALITSLSPITLFGAWSLRGLLSPSRVKGIIALSFVILGFFAMLWYSRSTNVWSPEIDIFPKHSAWYEAQLWAKNNTAKDALFITPPQIWWLYDLDWRVVSERSTVSTLSELLEVAFAPEYIPYWKSRFERIAPGAIDQFSGDIIQDKKTTKKAFYSLSAAEFKQIGTEYNASFLVVEKPYYYSLPVAYQNEQFIIYSL